MFPAGIKLENKKKEEVRLSLTHIEKEYERKER
jgi:hypothetical protein